MPRDMLESQLEGDWWYAQNGCRRNLLYLRGNADPAIIAKEILSLRTRTSQNVVEILYQQMWRKQPRTSTCYREHGYLHRVTEHEMVILEIKFKGLTTTPMLVMTSWYVTASVMLRMLLSELKDQLHLSTMTLCASHNTAPATLLLQGACDAFGMIKESQY